MSRYVSLCLSLAASLALTTAAFAADPAPAAGQTPAGPSPMILALIVIVFLGYFMLMRPNQTEQKKRQAALDALGKGDSVVTTGGILGTVESVDSKRQTVTVQVAPKISLEFTKASIATITPRKNATPAPDTAAVEIAS